MECFGEEALRDVTAAAGGRVFLIGNVAENRKQDHLTSGNTHPSKFILFYD